VSVSVSRSRVIASVFEAVALAARPVRSIADAQIRKNRRRRNDDLDTLPFTRWKLL
jgi:hypothetical protein